MKSMEQAVDKLKGEVTKLQSENTKLKQLHNTSKGESSLFHSEDETHLPLLFDAYQAALQCEDATKSIHSTVNRLCQNMDIN